MSSMQITFPGGLKVNALYNGFTIATDQSPEEGGEGTAPEPFDLFLASLGTCAGVYVLSFCRKRKLDTAGLSMDLRPVRNEDTGKLEAVELQIDLPPGFPDKYVRAVIKAAELCTVKRTLFDPPEVRVEAAVGIGESVKTVSR